MAQTNNKLLPGNLVTARDRTWVVQSGSSEDWLVLRPLSGADDESIELDPELEGVTLATFPDPDPTKAVLFSSAKVFYDALRFQLRSGAGPFRSFGSIAVEPRGYQLVPMIMAMQMETVRMLVADDVGIGKTIEAALIIREMVDRGEVDSFAVLCPPHLVDQWISELKERFNLNVRPLTSATAAKLERQVPHGKNLFDEFPYLVVSLDYIKSERNREYFRQVAPDLIVVDEAHTCTHTAGAKQLRYELLSRLAEKKERHLLFLTATPHSGNEEAFYNLLSLLDEKYGKLRDPTLAESERDVIKKDLTDHFVQRLRQDIIGWQANAHERLPNFPRKFTKEITYKLNLEWDSFFKDVMSYCRGLFASAEKETKEKRRNSLVWYVILALLRCVSSSPRAAETALENRLSNLEDQENLDPVDDYGEEAGTTSDTEPMANIDDSEELKKLLQKVRNLISSKNDPKLDLLVKHLNGLLEKGFSPIVFCRYISTAEYVAQRLEKEFPSYKVAYVTGSLVPEERISRVEELGAEERRILVTTDCLSEGVNLQDSFDAVVHYDLVWNPTRHAQREGRVDRFGQKSPEVRCLMLYGHDNPVDGFILNVILRKSEKIKKELGVLVPVPENTTRINEALIKAALFKRKTSDGQMELDFSDPDSFEEIADEVWEDPLKKAKRITTRYSHKGLHPENIVPLWEKQQEILGNHSDLEKFSREASAILGCSLEMTKKNDIWSIPTHTFRDASLRSRLWDEDIADGSEINLDALHRTSPFVNILSEAVVSQAVNENNSSLTRCAVAVTDTISIVTRIYLVRIRYQMFIRYRNQLRKCLLAEEIVPIMQEGRSSSWQTGDKVNKLIYDVNSSNIEKEAATRAIGKAIAKFHEAERLQIAEIIKQRAAELLADHRKVKNPEGTVTEVEACEPIDLLGVFVLLPDEE